MSVLVFALVSSALLCLLIGIAALARSGLRGHPLLVLAGVPVGAGIVLADLLWRTDRIHAIQLIDDLWVQLLLQAGAQALFFGLLLALAIDGLTRLLRRVRRGGDTVAATVGIGLGFAVASTSALLAGEAGWPPGALLVAMVNAPFQLAFAMLVGASIIESRQDERHRHRALRGQGGALLLQTGYQGVLVTTNSIGHWMAWLEPAAIGLVWLGLIALVWLAALALMTVQKRSEIPQRFLAEAGERSKLMRPRTWYVLAALVMLPSLVLFALGYTAAMSVPTGRVLMFALLAAPLMTGAVLWRTGLALRAGRQRG